MYTVRTGSDIAETQISDLSDAEVGVLLEVYEVLRLTPGNGRKFVPADMLPAFAQPTVNFGVPLPAGVPRSVTVASGTLPPAVQAGRRGGRRRHPRVLVLN